MIYLIKFWKFNLFFMIMKFFKLILKVLRENMVEKIRIYVFCGNKFKFECKRLVFIFVFFIFLLKLFVLRLRLFFLFFFCGGGVLE